MVDAETNERMQLILDKMNLSEFDRPVVNAAREKAKELKEKTGREVVSAVAIELMDGTIITGRATDTMRASASATLNALKHIAKISDEIHLLSLLHEYECFHYCMYVCDVKNNLLLESAMFGYVCC